MGKKALGVIYSDIHFNRWQQFWKSNGTDRLEWTIRAHKEIISKAKELGVPTLFCGDMFHDPKKLGNEVLDVMLPYLIQTYHNQIELAISGNHDQCKNNFIDNQSESYIKTISKVARNFRCIDFFAHDIPGARVFGIPYISHNLGFMEKVKELSKGVSKDMVNILMIHTDLPKAVTSTGYTFDDVDNIPEDYYKAFKKFDFVFNGHIHKPTLTPIHKNIYIIGSPIQQNLGDSHTEMGYWILWADKTIEFVPLKNYPQFFYHHKGDKIDEFNYWVELPEQTESDSSQGIQADYTSMKGRKKLVRKYMRKQGDKDKRRAKFLTKLLLDAESDI